MQKEGFKEAIDTKGNFEKGMPLFYKRIKESTFIIFNVPYYGKEKNADFQTDLWLVECTSANLFLKHSITDGIRRLILLGFELEKHLEIYKGLKGNN
ncbi:hypothetical protein NU09_0878 [Flavobacterium beibuense]|uniref:Uncharacterized protein n=2 Tax=Flavobacterium beibuense TaxID=657326 RepID=A0A444WEI9_9FLAO|nr:hypothetical protein NU09_0878 [Flavobacterium beibuense]